MLNNSTFTPLWGKKELGNNSYLFTESCTLSTVPDTLNSHKMLRYYFHHFFPPQIRKLKLRKFKPLAQCKKLVRGSKELSRSPFLIKLVLLILLIPFY